jgi:hypothetical protein
MQEFWDMSFMVDESAKIIEARGQCREHIGSTVQQVVGTSLLGYLAPNDRLHFRKFLAQLSKPNAKRAALVNVFTPAFGIRGYAMEAHVGRGAGEHWILLARARAGQAVGGVAELELHNVLAGESQFLDLIEQAAAKAREAMDLTVVEVGGLRDRARLKHVEHDVVNRLEIDVEATLVANAQEGIVTKASPGRYSLLHDRDTKVSKIEGDIREAADRRGVSGSALGLSLATMTVEPASNIDHVRALLQQAVAKLPQSAEISVKLGWLKQAIGKLKSGL